ncbi:MAG: PH domain-containing protein [Muribaculaceae bacterium]|nr:PH domain-containing protein [Muribaculaceae bacterium]
MKFEGILPIDKISEIRPTKTILAASATSLTHRIAIKFSDRKILKSSAPLVISPVRQDEFIAHLKAINPNIIVE